MEAIQAIQGAASEQGKNDQSDSTMTFITYIHVNSSKIEVYEKFIAELVAYTKEHEPGCLEYRWKKLPLTESTQTYLWFETFTSQTTFEEHMASPKFKEGVELFTKEEIFSKMPEMTILPKDLPGSFTR